VRGAFLFDLNRCTGCQACQLACGIENGLAWGESWRRVETFNPRRHPGAPVHHLSLACMHCEDAPCARICPALAIRRDAVTGAVFIDPSRCIGCRYCSWACPYDAPCFDEAAGVMGKCDFCRERLAAEREPACVQLCPTGALDCMVVGTGKSGGGSADESAGMGGGPAGREGAPAFDAERGEGVERIPGFPVADCGPAIRFLPLGEDLRQPAMAALHTLAEPDVPAPEHDAPVFAAAAEPQPSALVALALRRPTARIGLRHEWPLLVFTLTAAWLVAWWGSAGGGRVAMHPRIFMAAAALAMVVGALHLGRKGRAWRAVLNLRGSWISRELVAYGLFVATSAAYLYHTPPHPVRLRVALVLGFALLYCIDRVYDVAERRGSAPLHSADILLTGVTTSLLLSGLRLPALLFGLIKLGLYLQRKREFRQRGLGTSPRLSLLRVGLGLVLGGALWASGWQLAGLLAYAAGEIVDRAEFYAELDAPSPSRQMHTDLASALESEDRARATG